MNFKILLVIAATITITNFSYAQTIEAPTFGKGIFDIKSADSSWTMNFSARIQFLTTFRGIDDQEDGIEDPETNFLIRRARLKFGGYAYTPKLEYKIELGLSNRDIGRASEFTNNAPLYILDAVLKWNFYENFELWAGQTKLPGNRERVISSGDMSLVDRSLLNSRYNIDRDVGLQLHHRIDVSDNFFFTEALAFSQGEGRNVTSGNLGGYQYTARLEAYPFGDFQGKGAYSGSDLKREPTPKLAIGATYDFNDDAVKTRSNLGGYMTNDSGFYKTDITTFFVDAMFKYRGFSLMAEYANREADDPIAVNSDGTPTGDIVQVGNGINIQPGYLFKNNVELTARYTNIVLDQNITGRSPQDQYTLGLSKFFVGHKLKIQTDLSYLTTENADNEVMYRLQVDFHF